MEIEIKKGMNEDGDMSEEKCTCPKCGFEGDMSEFNGADNEEDYKKPERGGVKDVMMAILEAKKNKKAE